MNRTDVPIASPCSADWTTMTLAERGRFCGECRKVVHELSRLTESQARALLAAPSTEGLCVRYVHDATGEIVFRPDVPVSRLARAKRAVALAVGAAAIPVAVVGCMGPAPEPTATMGAVAPNDTQVVMGGMAPVDPPPTTAPTTSAAPIATDRPTPPQ
jgi:hypothetical protein